ncbi:MAG: hypothetical protein J1E36_03430 [Eubacterium sp.]|nr:hypothetical protein [Eubacterium sp.]
MRNLTIKRTKSFVACLANMKVYIEDPSSAEIMINNTPCRKIGTLKNGEEKTFVIDENAAKVFIIADKLSKGYCNDFFPIPAGEEDVFLSGKNQFNPANGNAFLFDVLMNEEMIQNRKNGTKKGIIVLIAAFIIGFIISFAVVLSSFSGAAKIAPKDFSSNGMTITLTNQFAETSMTGYTVCYDSKDVAVFALKEDFSLMDGFDNYTLEQYGELVLSNNPSASNCELKNDHGLTYFEYQFTNSQNNESYYYFTTLHKASDAFWIVQFVTSEGDLQQYQETFVEWAQTIEFS